MSRFLFYSFELQIEGELIWHTKYVPEVALHLSWPFTSTPSPKQHPVLPSPLTWDLGSSLARSSLQASLSIPASQSNHPCRHPENNQAGFYHLAPFISTTSSPPALTSVSPYHCSNQYHSHQLPLLPSELLPDTHEPPSLSRATTTSHRLFPPSISITKRPIHASLWPLFQHLSLGQHPNPLQKWERSPAEAVCKVNLTVLLVLKGLGPQPLPVPPCARQPKYCLFFTCGLYVAWNSCCHFGPCSQRP